MDTKRKNSCGICGGKLVIIRGRHPKTPKRKICPTCTYERLEQINGISSSSYGLTIKESNVTLRNREDE